MDGPISGFAKNGDTIKPGACLDTAPGSAASLPASAATLRVSIRVREHTLGVLTLDREAAYPVFTEQEKTRLAQLAPFVARALTDSPAQGAPWVETGEEGLIVADGGGKLCNLTTQAQQLLYLAAAPAGVISRNMDLPVPVIQLCSRLARSLDDKDSAAVVACWSQENHLGRFIFRVQRLEPAWGTPCQPLLGITLRRLEPLPFKLLRSIDKLPLSFREMQFCLVLAGGYSQAVIAQRMKISKHTVIAHRRHVYTKLAVRNRAELMSKLLAL